MSEAQEHLRLKFESETDIVVNEKPKSWKKYALWLENINVSILRDKLVKENNILRNNIQTAIDTLEEAITSRFD